MFNSDSLLNRHPVLAGLVWWVTVTVLGWLAFPLLFVSLPGLKDRGFGFARLFALLLIAYMTWLAASLRLFPNTRFTILRMVALVALSSVGVARLRWDDLKDFLERRWQTVLMIEGLFTLLFFLWVGVRRLQPDLWHPVVGGEKPMDFAYLNAVMKSTWFPPYNPWLSDTWINYYYFGFVIVGTLIKLIGTVPAIAYNLAVPLLFALTGLGAFSLAYNLSGDERAERGDRQALFAGLAAVMFTVLMGNLGVVHLLRNKLIAVGDVSFPSTIPPLPNTVSLLRGVWRVIAGGANLTMRPETWYWHPTRIIPSEAGNPIAEFPAFTFLYGDLHAHMIAFPLTLFALALGLVWIRERRPGWGGLLLGGLVIGALRPTNTWDYPTYLLLGVLALGIGAWQARVGQTDEKGGSPLPARLAAFVRQLAWRIPALVGLTLLLYLPYIRDSVTGYNAFRLWEGENTPLGIYLWIHGTLLFPVATWLLIGGIERSIHRGIPRGIALAAIGGTVVLGLAMLMLGVQVGLVAVPILALAAMLFLLPAQIAGHDASAEGVSRPGGRKQLLWLMVAAAMALSLGVEILVLEGDIGRMNTVFKFYLQVWIMLSIAAAVSLAWIWTRSRHWERNGRQLWWSATCLLVLGGMLFLPFGVRARAIARMAPETGLTLDGMAFMEHAVIQDGPEGHLEAIALVGDYHAIRWMQENVSGSPVILEGLGRREYLWANRVSIYTGLPAVVGWRWHQTQQRAGVGGDMVAWRRDDVSTCYQTTDVAEAQEILERYDVRYVYAGAYERAYYGSAGLDKFDRMAEDGVLRVVYQDHGVTIYEVV
jgi:YYY domain-containing protein